MDVSSVCKRTRGATRVPAQTQKSAGNPRKIAVSQLNRAPHCAPCADSAQRNRRLQRSTGSKAFPSGPAERGELRFLRRVAFVDGPVDRVSHWFVLGGQQPFKRRKLAHRVLCLRPRLGIDDIRWFVSCEVFPQVLPRPGHDARVGIWSRLSESWQRRSENQSGQRKGGD